MKNRWNLSIGAIYRTGILIFILFAGVTGCNILRINGMFHPHAYNWRNGMPPLKDQVTTFQQANKRWPTNYDDLVVYMRLVVTNYVPESYDRIEFVAQPNGNLVINIYVSETKRTNSITLEGKKE